MYHKRIRKVEGGGMKRLFVLLIFTGSFAHPQPIPVGQQGKKFDFKARFDWYAKRTYTNPWHHVWLIGGVAVNDYAFGEIDKWGSGLSGFGKSLAPVYGQIVISNTIELFAGEIVGDDARYRPSTSRGLVKRGLHTTVSTFTARAKSGNIRPAYSRIIAVTAALLISNRWRPYPRTGFSLSHALVFSVTDMAQDNLLIEFSPDLKRVGHKFWHKIHPAKKTKNPPKP